MYVFYINGGRVEKRFGREFVNYVCGGKIKQDIKADECTRKRVVVRSRYAAKKLLEANNRVYWPDGTLFQCKLMKPDRRSPLHRVMKHFGRNTDRKKDNRDDDFTRRERPERTYVKFRSPSPVLTDDWYNSEAFIDVDLGDGDDDKKSLFGINEHSLDSLHRELHTMSL